MKVKMYIRGHNGTGCMTHEFSALPDTGSDLLIPFKLLPEEWVKLLLVMKTTSIHLKQDIMNVQSGALQASKLLINFVKVEQTLFTFDQTTIPNEFAPTIYVVPRDWMSSSVW